MNKYFIAEFKNEKFDSIKNISQYKTNLNFVETLEFLKSKISDDRHWELISIKSEKYLYIEHLYQFKHSISIKDIYEELRDISRNIDDNLDFLYREIKEKNDNN